MKSGILVFRLADCLIKKIFFKSRKNDIYHECKGEQITTPEGDEKEIEEYTKNYRSTTRWQTL